MTNSATGQTHGVGNCLAARYRRGSNRFAANPSLAINRIARMGSRRLLWQIYPAYLLITLAALFAVWWFASQDLGNWYLETITDDLRSRAELAAQEISPYFPPVDTVDEAIVEARAQTACEKIAQITKTRITVILPDGRVACDTEEPPAKLDNHQERPEIQLALAGGTGTSTRFSDTLKTRMRYLALPIVRGGKVVAVMRTAVSISSIDDVRRALQWKIAGGGLAAALLAAGASWILTRRISQPLEDMRRGAERFARGELGYKLPLADSEELAGLAEALNQMAAQLEERIRTVVQQRNERDAVLSSMVEGVLAVDSQERVISLNRAAAELIGGDVNNVSGRSLPEVVRNAELLKFVREILSGREPVEHEIVLRRVPENVLRIRGAALHDAAGRSRGAVVVLNDVTQFRHLETVRRDFVANVSHELKTPIASIKGFVETLIDGAMKQPEDAVRFLQIIAKQADRLHAIVDDLLALSKIEQTEDVSDLDLEVLPLKPVIEDALHTCQPQAFERNVQVHLLCPDNLSVKMNAHLLEQAIANLLDNAIKYSEPGKEVVVEAAPANGEAANGEIMIQVRDQGFGIAKEHLARVFERFYRVDKGRSRKMGGTGLGLAIVKHIVGVHGGRISVESTLGQGSTFTLHLPSA